jgi:hypothetical protein
MQHHYQQAKHTKLWPMYWNHLLVVGISLTGRKIEACVMECIMKHQTAGTTLHGLGLSDILGFSDILLSQWML